MKLATDKPNEFPLIWQWMNKRVRLPWSTDLRTIACVRDDGSIACAVGFNAWTMSSCWLHVAFDTPHSLTRSLWRAAFKYPFIDCGMEAVYGLTPKGNDEALAMNRKLGFRQVAETIDCVMFEMKADECRWTKENAHGRQRVSTSTS